MAWEFTADGFSEVAPPELPPTIIPPVVDPPTVADDAPWVTVNTGYHGPFSSTGSGGGVEFKVTHDFSAVMNDPRADPAHPEGFNLRFVFELLPETYYQQQIDVAFETTGGLSWGGMRWVTAADPQPWDDVMLNDGSTDYTLQVPVWEDALVDGKIVAHFGPECGPYAGWRYQIVAGYWPQGGTSPIVTTVAPPLRVYPRSDGLGASSQARIWPRPGSVQASNRRGTSYL